MEIKVIVLALLGLACFLAVVGGIVVLVVFAIRQKSGDKD